MESLERQLLELGQVQAACPNIVQAFQLAPRTSKKSKGFCRAGIRCNTPLPLHEVGLHNGHLAFVYCTPERTGAHVLKNGP